MRNFVLAIIAAITAFGFIQQNETITIKGSDTMVILAQQWAEVYMSKHPGVTIQITGGGSGTGISALINGTTDICNASRPMKRSEKEKLKQRFNTLGVEIKSAKDGLAVYVNKANPIQELTLSQLRDIYSGTVTNWKAVGGPTLKSFCTAVRTIPVPTCISKTMFSKEGTSLPMPKIYRALPRW